MWTAIFVGRLGTVSRSSNGILVTRKTAVDRQRKIFWRLSRIGGTPHLAHLEPFEARPPRATKATKATTAAARAGDQFADLILGLHCLSPLLSK